jgi:hypothetical protein
MGVSLLCAGLPHYEDRILDNVRRHMEQADAFIADITTGNPNVMFELGAARFASSTRPIVLLYDAQSPDQRLPADLQSLIYLDYSQATEPPLADWLHTEMRRNQSLTFILDAPDREHFVSPRQLKERARNLVFPDDVFHKLSERFPTQEAWQTATEADLRPLLGKDDADFAVPMLNRIQAG